MKKLLISVALFATVQTFAGSFDNTPVYRSGTDGKIETFDVKAAIEKCEKDISEQVSNLQKLKVTILKINKCESRTYNLYSSSAAATDVSVNGSITFLK